MAGTAGVPLSSLCPHPATLEGAAVRLAPCVSTLLALARFGPTEWPGSTAFAQSPLSLVPGAMPVPGVSCSPGDLEMSSAAVRRPLGSWEVPPGRRAGGCRGCGLAPAPSTTTSGRAGGWAGDGGRVGWRSTASPLCLIVSLAWAVPVVAIPPPCASSIATAIWPVGASTRGIIHAGKFDTPRWFGAL